VRMAADSFRSTQHVVLTSMRQKLQPEAARERGGTQGYAGEFRSTPTPLVVVASAASFVGVRGLSEPPYPWVSPRGPSLPAGTILTFRG
jgi:hypothetical protein